VAVNVGMVAAERKAGRVYPWTLTKSELSVELPQCHRKTKIGAHFRSARLDEPEDSAVRRRLRVFDVNTVLHEVCHNNRRGAGYTHAAVDQDPFPSRATLVNERDALLKVPGDVFVGVVLELNVFSGQSLLDEVGYNTLLGDEVGD